MTCKREGCRKPVGPVARKHGDPYCSTTCFKADRGIITHGDAVELQRHSDRSTESRPRSQWKGSFKR